MRKLLMLVSIFTSLLVLPSCTNNIPPDDDLLGENEPFFTCLLDGQEFVSHVETAGIVATTNNDDETVYEVIILGNPVGSMEVMTISLFVTTDFPLPGYYESFGVLDDDNETNVLCMYSLDGYTIYYNSYDSTYAKIDYTTMDFEEDGWVSGTFSAVLREEGGTDFKTITNGAFKIPTD